MLVLFFFLYLFFRAAALTQTKKKGFDLKSGTIEKIRQAVDEYKSVFAFSFDNMRSAKFKECRIEFREDRFFLGKNKVMKVALGKTPEDEYRDELHQVSEVLSGNVGLLATNRPKNEVVKCAIFYWLALNILCV